MCKEEWFICFVDCDMWREVREKSMEKQVEIYQNEIKKLLEENKRLKRENIMLTRKLERLTMK